MCVLSAGMPPPGFPPVPPPGTMPPQMPPSMGMPPNAGGQGGGGLPPGPPHFPPGSMHPGKKKRGAFDSSRRVNRLLILRCLPQVCPRWPWLLRLPWCLHLLHQDRLNQEHHPLLACLLRPWACHPERPMALPWVRNSLNPPPNKPTDEHKLIDPGSPPFRCASRSERTASTSDASPRLRRSAAASPSSPSLPERTAHASAAARGPAPRSHESPDAAVTLGRLNRVPSIF